MRVNAYERVTLAAARDLALQTLDDNEAARRWRDHAIDSDEELALAMDVLRDVVTLMNESRGVDGYHLNGDVAEWDEFDWARRARTLLGG